MGNGGGGGYLIEEDFKCWVIEKVDGSLVLAYVVGWMMNKMVDAFW